MNESLLAALRAEALPCAVNEPLARHTTFRIGGPADGFCQPETVPQLARTLELCRAHGERVYLLGNGSNTLFADAGFRGTVICLTRLHSRFTVDRFQDGSALVRAGVGLMLSTLCSAVQKESLSDLEFAYGIPGTVGGAVYMDAGAYGGEIKDVLTDVTFLDENQHLCTRPVDRLELGYRTSIFERKPWCILEAGLCLKADDPSRILARMQDYMQRRREKQPLEYPSGGSTFKRPAGHFAAALIDQCGLKGLTVGGAQVSEKHCGFVINKGNATAADVRTLMEEVTRRVEEQFGVRLEPEVKITINYIAHHHTEHHARKQGQNFL